MWIKNLMLHNTAVYSTLRPVFLELFTLIASLIIVGFIASFIVDAGVVYLYDK